MAGLKGKGSKIIQETSELCEETLSSSLSWSVRLCMARIMLGDIPYQHVRNNL